MKYKMVCIDMDGTLLSKGGKVSDENRESISKAHEKGVEIVVTTGRIYNNAAYFSHILGVKSPVIAANGAIVKDKNNDNIIYEGSIPNIDCLEIIETLNKYKIAFQMYTNDTIYCSNKITKVVTKIFMSKHVGDEALKINYIKVRKIKKWKKILENNEGKITKFIAISLNTKKVSFVKQKLRDMKNITICGAGFR
ncbi:MAG: HAD-IIB family hydrolase, partial [Clostridium sp.]